MFFTTVVVSILMRQVGGTRVYRDWVNIYLRWVITRVRLVVMPSKSLPALVAALVLAFAAQAAAATTSPPHLMQADPRGDGAISIVKAASGDYTLQFASHIDVLSDGGQIQIAGNRKDGTVDTMDAFQNVNGSSVLAGALQYNYDASHEHWHYLALDRYDLRTHDSALTAVSRDQKTGFCLVWTDALSDHICQHNNPNADSVSETIPSGGYDVYDPARDGQFIDIQGIKPGEYELVEWVNADCRLIDTGPQDHTWAEVIKITYSGTTPVLTEEPSEQPDWYAHYSGLGPSGQCLPHETVRPIIGGNAQVGSILSSTPGSWLERMATSFSYQWRTCDATGWACSDIPGATSANYAPVAADLGHTLRARITALNAATMEEASPQDSEATGVVQSAPSSPVPPSGSSPVPPSGGVLGVGPIPSFTAALTARRLLSIRYLMAHGVRTRVRCSMRCRVRVGIEANGSVPLGHVSGALSHAGSRLFPLRFSSKARKVLRHYRSGRLRIWLHVKSSDGERQTLERTLRLR